MYLLFCRYLEFGHILCDLLNLLLNPMVPCILRPLLRGDVSSPNNKKQSSTKQTEIFILTIGGVVHYGAHYGLSPAFSR